MWYAIFLQATGAHNHARQRIPRPLCPGLLYHYPSLNRMGGAPVSLLHNNSCLHKCMELTMVGERARCSKLEAEGSALRANGVGGA